MADEPDCPRCRHFVVTWRPEHPRGCRLYGFEGTRLPAQVVQEATGEACRGFEPRAAAPRPPGRPEPGWRA